MSTPGRQVAACAKYCGNEFDVAEFEEQMLTARRRIGGADPTGSCRPVHGLSRVGVALLIQPKLLGHRANAELSAGRQGTKQTLLETDEPRVKRCRCP